MPRENFRRVYVNQFGTSLSGANIIGANAKTSFAAASAGAVAADIRAPFVNIVGIGGDYPLGTGTVFLQLFGNSATVPADNAVPDISIRIDPAVTANRRFFEDLRDRTKRLQTPISWCISTTGKIKTIDATANDYANWFLDIEEVDTLPDGLSASGDFTTAVDSLQVWAEAAGPKKLYRVEATWNSAEGTMYVLLFAKDAPAANEIPLWASPLMTNGGTAVMSRSFGMEGREVYSRDSDGTERKGCSLFFSTDQKKLAQPLTTPGTIKAYYK